MAKSFQQPIVVVSVDSVDGLYVEQLQQGARGDENALSIIVGISRIDASKAEEVSRGWMLDAAAL